MADDDTASTSHPPDDQTPLGRLAHAFRFATQRVEPDQEMPERPPEVEEWARNTSLAMFAGMCFLGAREVARNRRLGPYKPTQPGLSKPQAARLIAEENTRRLLRLCNEAIRGGVRFGSLAALFYGVQLLSAVARGERSVADTVTAGAAAGGVFGGLLPGALAHKLRSSVLGSALGATAGFPVGLLQARLQAQLPEQGAGTGAPEARPKRRFPELQGDPTEAVIQQLEARLRK